MEVRSTSSAAAVCSAASYRPAVAVLRHGEREDGVWNSPWFQSEDAKRHPYDARPWKWGTTGGSLPTDRVFVG